MQILYRSALVAALALAPGAAIAQMVIEKPILEEPVLVIPEPSMTAAPMVGGGIMAEDARAIAMMNGVVEVDDVDQRWWDGNYEVDGTDASGEDMEVTIDGETGAVLEIDD